MNGHTADRTTTPRGGVCRLPGSTPPRPHGRRGAPRGLVLEAGPAVLPVHESPGARGNEAGATSSTPAGHSPGDTTNFDAPPREAALERATQVSGADSCLRSALCEKEYQYKPRPNTSGSELPQAGAGPSQQVTPMQSYPGRARDFGALALSRRGHLGPGRPPLLPSPSLYLVATHTGVSQSMRLTDSHEEGASVIRGKHAGPLPRNHQPTHTLKARR